MLHKKSHFEHDPVRFLTEFYLFTACYSHWCMQVIRLPYLMVRDHVKIYKLSTSDFQLTEACLLSRLEAPTTTLAMTCWIP